MRIAYCDSSREASANAYIDESRAASHSWIFGADDRDHHGKYLASMLDVIGVEDVERR
jgi:FMN-dependent NADH-azoreductase